MFTGIIEATAPLKERTPTTLTFERSKEFHDCAIGSSVAVSGVCLSVVAMTDDTLTFDVVPETLKKSTLGLIAIGDSVNFERAMRVDSRFDGHIVQGHVEGVGSVIAVLDSKAPSPSPLPRNGGGVGGGGVEHVKRGIGKWKYPVKTVISHARSMIRKPTKSEVLLWARLRKRALNGAYFRRQRPIGNYVVDFYCEEARLGVEIDGKNHQKPEECEYDFDRTRELEARGIRIIRFTNKEVKSDLPNVIQRVKDVICERAQSSSSFCVANVTLKIKIPDALLPSITPKGSIAIDGVSLTVAAMRGNEVMIALIPHTLESTTLGSLQVGDSVNIETDVLVRHLHRLTTIA